MTVTPASNMPKITKKAGGRLVICNLQRTPLDDMADLRIFARCDDLMKLVMQQLRLEVPPFILHRRVIVESEHEVKKKREAIRLAIRGVDVDGIPSSFLHHVDWTNRARMEREGHVCKATASLDVEPFSIQLERSRNVRKDDDDDTFGSLDIDLRLAFMGHYNEPSLTLTHTVGGVRSKSSSVLYLLDYNPLTGEWRMKKKGADEADVQEEEVDEGNAKLMGDDGDDEMEVDQQAQKRTLIIGNRCREIPRKNSGEQALYEWEMYVKGGPAADDGSDFVESVEYTLHPTFSPSRVTVTSEPGFILKRVGWGVFKVGVCIRFKNGKGSLRTDHMLRFDPLHPAETAHTVEV